MLTAIPTRRISSKNGLRNLLSYELLPKGGSIGDYIGSVIEVVKGDTRSLACSHIGEGYCIGFM